MSWFHTIVDTIFPEDTKGALPSPPSIMAAGSPWYKELSPEKEEVIERITKDVLKKNPRFKTLALYKIITEIIGDTNIYSYRDYYTSLHNNFVEETIEKANEQYKERHEKNMLWWYTIARLKSTAHKMIERWRNKQRQQFWKKIENGQN